LVCSFTNFEDYGPQLFKALGYSPAQNLLFQAGNILQGLSAVIASVFIVDRFPRNKLLATGMIVCAINLSGVAAMNARFLGTSNKSGLAAGVAFIFMYVWFYGFLLDGVGYFYAAEIFPTHLRAKGTTCCLASYCLVNILWLQVAPTAFANIGWKFYMVFICMSLLGAAIMYFTFPDTLNKPLEEIARLFGDKDLVAIYQEDIVLDEANHEVVEKASGSDEHVELASELNEMASSKV
jgi:MFS family permease